MGPGDDTVCVDTLCRASDHGLEVVLEVGRLKVGVQLLGGDVAEVFGEFRVVITTDTPRQLVFGQVAGNELDRVEWIGFTGLSGGEDSGVDGFLGNLIDELMKRQTGVG